VLSGTQRARRGLACALPQAAGFEGATLNPQNVGLDVFAAQRASVRIQLSGTAFSHMRVVWSRAWRVVPGGPQIG
jgi:hypothetical protein